LRSQIVTASWGEYRTLRDLAPENQKAASSGKRN